MLRATSVAEPTASESGTFSAEFQTAVKSELEAMLLAPIFLQSGRCKRFLSYIVDQTLSGSASQLKERTNGIGVFERANDYDTGDDSIVRVTANEVRKRISQFYRESPQPLIQIELPRGSYVPEFGIHIEEMSATDTANTLEISKENVNVRLHRARVSLRKKTARPPRSGTERRIQFQFR